MWYTVNGRQEEKVTQEIGRVEGIVTYRGDVIADEIAPNASLTVKDGSLVVKGNVGKGAFVHQIGSATPLATMDAKIDHGLFVSTARHNFEPGVRNKHVTTLSQAEKMLKQTKPYQVKATLVQNNFGVEIIGIPTQDHPVVIDGLPLPTPELFPAGVTIDGNVAPNASIRAGSNVLVKGSTSRTASIIAPITWHTNEHIKDRGCSVM
jgi:hypothetical protein